MQPNEKIKIIYNADQIIMHNPNFNIEVARPVKRKPKKIKKSGKK